MTTETLDPTILVRTLLNSRRGMSLALLGAARNCAEVRTERDALRSSIERAVHDLRNGWSAAALDVLERAIAPEAEPAQAD